MRSVLCVNGRGVVLNFLKTFSWLFCKYGREIYVVCFEFLSIELGQLEGGLLTGCLEDDNGRLTAIQVSTFYITVLSGGSFVYGCESFFQGCRLSITILWGRLTGGRVRFSGVTLSGPLAGCFLLETR